MLLRELARDNISFAKRVSGLEWLISVHYDTRVMLSCLHELGDFVGQDIINPIGSVDIPADVLDAMHAISNASNPTENETDLDRLQSMVRSNGKRFVAMAVFPQLTTNADYILAGLLVSYARLFLGAKNNSSRLQLKPEQVFGGKSDVRSCHDNLIDKRHGVYAHEEISTGYVRLNIAIGAEGDYSVKDNSGQQSLSFYPGVIPDFYKCLICLRDYLGGKILEDTAKLNSKLNDEYRELILEKLKPS
ncbi:hypothetical protein [Salinicola endophyticus]|uniref:Uncharacterized protein n=1 Tax=Salinicola endophyticus TaxID=1949083 RepID=A0AB74UFY4_9GAMM